MWLSDGEVVDALLKVAMNGWISSMDEAEEVSVELHE